MSAWRFLRIAIPLGTLAFLAIGGAIARWGKDGVERVAISKPATANIPALPPEDLGHGLVARIVDAEGAGVADALVWLRSHDAPRWGYSDRQGRVRVTELAPGPWQALLSAPNFAPRTLEVAELPAEQTLTLGPARPPVPVFPPMPRTNLSGKLSSPLALAFAGYEIVLVPRDPPETIGAPLPRRAASAADGSFHFDGLIEGAYRVHVLPPWAKNGSWPDLVHADAAQSGGGRAFEHRAGAGELALLLDVARVNGVLVDALGTPVEGALLLLTPVNDEMRPWPPAASGADGHFTLGDLPPGRYAIAVRAGGKSLVQQVELGAGEERALELHLP